MKQCLKGSVRSSYGDRESNGRDREKEEVERERERHSRGDEEQGRDKRQCEGFRWRVVAMTSTKRAGERHSLGLDGRKWRRKFFSDNATSLKTGERRQQGRDAERREKLYGSYGDDLERWPRQRWRQCTTAIMATEAKRGERNRQRLGGRSRIDQIWRFRAHLAVCWDFK